MGQAPMPEPRHSVFPPEKHEKAEHEGRDRD
jgi:hypothetical protein